MAANKRKQGLSMEEKCERVEAYLAEQRVPFTLKELEAILPRAKGVIFQSVQECLDTLVSENRAETDKVGINTLFWNFFDGTEKARNNNNKNNNGKNNSNGGGGVDPIPQTLEGKKARVELLLQKKQGLTAQLDEVTKQVAAATDTPEAVQHRATLLHNINELRNTKRNLQQQVQEQVSAMAISPQRLRRQHDLLRQLVNMWTDNVMLLEDCATRGAGGGCAMFATRGEFRRQFGIADDFDFV